MIGRIASLYGVDTILLGAADQESRLSWDVHEGVDQGEPQSDSNDLAVTGWSGPDGNNWTCQRGADSSRMWIDLLDTGGDTGSLAGTRSVHISAVYDR